MSLRAFLVGQASRLFIRMTGKMPVPLAISRPWGLLSRGTRDNDKSTPLATEESPVRWIFFVDIYRYEIYRIDLSRYAWMFNRLSWDSSCSRA